jgi:uncharacterized protein
VRINIHEIEESPKERLWTQPAEELNRVFEHGRVHDYTFPNPTHVAVRYYRAGQELFFAGQADCQVTGECARCLEDYGFEIVVPFSFVMVPHTEQREGDEIEAEDVHLSYYRGLEIDLWPLVREQIILALPTQPLCREDCRGLCPHCGANLNATTCACPASSGDPRLAVLRGLRVGS